MMMMMILLHIKTSNPTLLRERSRTADQCKQTGRENGPRLRRKCLNSDLSYRLLLTSRVTPRGERNQAMSSQYSSLRSYSISDLVFTRRTSRLEARDRSALVLQFGARLLCFNCTNCVLYLHIYRSHTTNQTLSSRRRTNKQGRDIGVSDQCYLGDLAQLHAKTPGCTHHLSFVLGQQELLERESAPEITGARVNGAFKAVACCFKRAGVLFLIGGSSQLGLSIVSSPNASTK